MTMILKIGRRLTLNVNTIAEASKAYEAARDESGEGASTFPTGTISVGGKAVYHVSYNARVWNYADRNLADKTPVYEPGQDRARSTMTPEAVAFIDQLKTVDESLAMYAEVRIDGGKTLDDTIEKLRGAMRIVEAERAKPRPIGDLVDEDVERAIAEGRHFNDAR